MNEAMLWHEIEGPRPVTGRCTDIVTRVEGPHLRAYLRLVDVAELRTGHVQSGLGQLVEDRPGWLLGLDKLYSIGEWE